MFWNRVKRAVGTFGGNLLERFKREPAVVRLALMGVLGSLALWTPEQLAGFEQLLDTLIPALLVLLGADLRGNVTPAKKPAVTVPLPATLPLGPGALAPEGLPPSGAF